jgi:ACS family hexuronate transporter-like MFS transporter
MYRSPEEHPRLSRAELDYIHSDPQDPAPPKIPWVNLLGHRQTWVFLLGKFLTDPVWWLYLFWVPDFLHTRHGLNLKDFGPPLVVIYLMTDVGSIAGGWMSSRLIKHGWTVNKARKITMLTCALCVVPIMLASVVSNLWVAVIIIGIAASAHQGWSANIFTLVSDTVPKHAVSSVTGIGGMAGAVGGMLIAKVVGYILQATNNNYLIPFIIASVMYLVALAVIHLLNPKLEPMQFKEQPAAS